MDDFVTLDFNLTLRIAAALNGDTEQAVALDVVVFDDKVVGVVRVNALAVVIKRAVVGNFHIHVYRTCARSEAIAGAAVFLVTVTFEDVVFDLAVDLIGGGNTGNAVMVAVTVDDAVAHRVMRQVVNA